MELNRIARFRLESAEIWSENVRCSSNMTPKVTSRVSGVKRRVTYFSKLLFKSYEKKFSLGGVKS